MKTLLKKNAPSNKTSHVGSVVNVDGNQATKTLDLHFP